MKITLSTIYLLGILSGLLKANYSCISRCPVSNFHNSICASDKKVYKSICHAKCQNFLNYSLFHCGLAESQTDCVHRCSSYSFNSNPTKTSIHIKVTNPPANSRINYCEQNCSLHSSNNFFCGTDNNLHKNTCYAKCKGQHIGVRFYCSSFNTVSICQQICQRGHSVPVQNVPVQNVPIHPVPIHSPIVTPIVVPRPCDDEDLLCASNGYAYEGNCSDHFNHNIHVLFNCSKNGIHSHAKCQNLCSSFANNHCLTNCRSIDNSPICYSNGEVFTNKCLATCMHAQPVFKCGFRKRKCKRKCKRYAFNSPSGHILGSSRPR